MARRKIIARCIVEGVSGESDDKPSSMIGRAVSSFLAFFALYQVSLNRHDAPLFKGLREKIWMIDESAYLGSFLENDKDEEDRKDGMTLQAMGDMGYSGSTFFTTWDQQYLVKSIPRHFEHSFFREDLLQPYQEHVTAHRDSALVRITDMLAACHHTIGIPLGFAPSHHIVMENLLYGAADHKRDSDPHWESFDLKPTSYFFPERDIASGKLSSEATKSRLADDFNDKIVLDQEQASDFLRILETDTRLLAQSNAVDYSLFLVRITLQEQDPFQDSSIIPKESPFTPPSPPSWRTGVASPDGKHVYRAAILDFFWAKHTTHAKLMTGLIEAWNLIDRQGPMSITTTPDEYRQRFLSMVKHYVEVVT